MYILNISKFKILLAGNDLFLQNTFAANKKIAYKIQNFMFWHFNKVEENGWIWIIVHFISSIFYMQQPINSNTEGTERKIKKKKQVLLHPFTLTVKKAK